MLTTTRRVNNHNVANFVGLFALAIVVGVVASGSTKATAGEASQGRRNGVSSDARGALPAPRFAYITNQVSQTVSVVALDRFVVVGEIAVAGRPAGIALSPQHDELYVSAPEARDVAVIDTATRAIVRRLPIGSGPLGLAVSPKTGLLYVADWYSHVVRAADPKTGATLHEIPVGQSPSGIAVSADGRIAVTADRDSNQISVIDLVRHTVTATIGVGGRPFGITLNAEGNRAYTANVATNDVSVIDVAAGKVIATVPVGRRPYAVALTGDRAFVTDQYSGTVTVFSTDTHRVLDTIEACDHPEGIAFHTGRAAVYVACWGDNEILEINAGTLAISRRLKVGDGPRAFGDFLGR